MRASPLAHRLASERGFEMEKLARAVEDQVRGRRVTGVDFDFEATDGTRVPLGSEMLVVLDEGRAIARARDEIWVGTEDGLAAMAADPPAQEIRHPAPLHPPPFGGGKRSAPAGRLGTLHWPS